MNVHANSYADERVHVYTVSAVQGGSCQTAVAVGVPLALLAAAAALTNSTLLAALFLLWVVVAAINAALQVTSESLTVLKGVGVLLSTKKCCLGTNSRFHDLQDIHSVIINETLTTININVHLAFLLYDNDKLAVAFPNTCPGVSVLIPIYKELQSLVGQPAANDVM